MGEKAERMTRLYWQPEIKDWKARTRALGKNPSSTWDEAVALANAPLDFVQTNQLDEMLRRVFREAFPSDLATKPIRLAILSSCTVAHLHAAIRMAGVRRGIWIETYETDYGQYLQELSDVNSGLHAFKPTTVLVALDAYHLAAGVDATFNKEDSESVAAALREQIRDIWRQVRQHFGCPIVHQTALPVHHAVLGNNEHRLAGSKVRFIAELNHDLRAMADEASVDLLAVDRQVCRDGLARWHDIGLWHRSKQEISPVAAPMYGDLVGRLIASKQGRSSKCLILDLDNTVWGGVIGDDGMEGIIIGQGSGAGEAYLSLQSYARELSRRGVILAVCSKNDEAVALEPFEKHPEMILRRDNLSSFVANWTDKAANIRSIAEELNIGLDSLVFLDDNPFERNLVRQELPMVAVPEVPDDSAYYAQVLEDAGYFEGLTITEEDKIRTQQYQSNRAREALKASATDLDSYLRSMEMTLVCRPFDRIGLQRTVQLINKTNQFNLTTRRYTEEDVLEVMKDTKSFGLQLRLIDRFGDNGIIAIIIGKMNGSSDLDIDTWLMSCRVLGRQVEVTTLNLIAAEAKRLGAKRLIGCYIPTKKNGMVKDHYAKLGFTALESAAGGGKACLDLSTFKPAETFITINMG